jgi:hypothetical protein
MYKMEINVSGQQVASDGKALAFDWSTASSKTPTLRICRSSSRRASSWRLT